MSEQQSLSDALSEQDKIIIATLLGRLFQTNWKLCDCIGVSIASHQDRLPVRYISEDAGNTMLEYAFSEGAKMLDLLNDTQKALGIDKPIFDSKFKRD